jgi:hypothetical protein
VIGYPNIVTVLRKLLSGLLADPRVRGRNDGGRAHEACPSTVTAITNFIIALLESVWYFLRGGFTRTSEWQTKPLEGQGSGEPYLDSTT